MDLAIQVGFYVIGIPLELLAISAILRDGFRRYPLVFAYTIALFLVTLVEMPVNLAFYSGDRSAATVSAVRGNYWRDEAILQVTIFAVVISLIYSATSRLPSRRIVRLTLVAGALIFVAISLLVHYSPNPKIGIWMTPWTRDLKFCSAILDLALWALLIRAQEKNRTLLAVSGGLGIMFAGGAIGEAIRNIATPAESHLIATVGAIIIMSADLVLLYILWQVFRKQPGGGALQKKSRP
jgi:hypothetical protein